MIKSDYRPDKETEIFHDDATSVFHFPWEFSSIYQASMSPNIIIEYQNEKLFAPHFSGNASAGRTENPWIHLICADHRSSGFKVAKVFYSKTTETKWMEMKRRKADNVELSLFMAQSSGSLLRYYTDHLNFRMEMTSTIGNYHYEIMDTSWTTQLWQAALDQQLTDVEIIVGPVKLEAHRVILSARSPVLAVLLKNNDQVKSPIVIEVNMDICVVKPFLKFLYTGCLEISATNKQLLELAKMYQVETLMKICQVANCISPDVTSKLDASKVDVPDKPSVTFEMNLEVVNHFMTFLSRGSLDSSVNIRQITALAELYEVGTLKRICELNRNVPLDIDEVATFLLTTL
jgi:speckle-type POZ protein